MRALSLESVAAGPTVRQRLDIHAASWFDLVAQMRQKLLSSRINGKAIDFETLACGYTAVDLDTFAMDNSSTKKELVGRTYAGVDSYCPFAVYLGSRGYCPEALALNCEIAFIIKWSPRRAPVETLAARQVADTDAQWVIHRPGKRQCIWQETLELAGVGSETNPAWRVYRLIERTIDKHGVILLLPDYVLEGWTTTLPARFTPTEIISLYCDHATHEQFHSEFKTDMDLERLPSGKFDANYLVCQFAAVAMTLLHLIGQNTLNEPDTPVRHTAKRRSIKTVMQEHDVQGRAHDQACRALDSGLGVRATAALRCLSATRSAQSGVANQFAQNNPTI